MPKQTKNIKSCAPAPLSGQSGFTLIELLVVIAIIGLLASVVLVSLNSARQKARVAKRVADLTQIQNALELYYSDNNSYPNSASQWRSQCPSWQGVAASQVVWDTTLSKGLVPTYISSFPSDPSMNTGAEQNCYLYNSNGTDYKLLDYHISDMSAADLAAHSSFEDPLRTAIGQCGGQGDFSPLSMSVYSPGGACW